MASQVPSNTVPREFQCRDCGKFFEIRAEPGEPAVCPVCDLDNAVYPSDTKSKETARARSRRGIIYTRCCGCGAEYHRSKKDRNFSKCPQCKQLNVLQEREPLPSSSSLEASGSVAQRPAGVSRRLSEGGYGNDVVNGFPCRECGALNLKAPEPNRFSGCTECGFDNAVYAYDSDGDSGTSQRLARGKNYFVCEMCGAEYQKSKTDHVFTKCPQCKHVNTLKDSKPKNGRGSAVSESESTKSGSGNWGTFAAVLGAIFFGVAFFAPERLPPGFGLAQVPIEVSFRESLLGEGKVVIIHNPTGHTLHNVNCMRKDRAGVTDLRSEESFAPGRSVEIGWAEGWRWQSGETLTVSASGFASKTVSCGP